MTPADESPGELAPGDLPGSLPLAVTLLVGIWPYDWAGMKKVGRET
ncbi:MAG: hypothetical protein JO329_18335 [Planctomycetaceae bacterium]|nr:hypothetical protein [Planctomycetaceae bacterium]MBV8557348.1 hypothetical protein [Planctomycetaceae bacterium]MBV8606769.1 hypothetical protein [Singulisphaera sp.]